MPIVLYFFGRTRFFYSNEESEPVNIHAIKGDMECKFWLLVDEVEMKEAFAFNLIAASTRELKKYHDFDLKVDSWKIFYKKSW